MSEYLSGARRGADQIVAGVLPARQEDGLPIIGAAPGVDGAYVATGHSVWGMLNAPATGEAMSELILDGAARHVDLAPFAPGRLPPLDGAPARPLRGTHDDAEMAYRSGRGLWRLRRFSLRSTALPPIFSRAPANGPVGRGLTKAEEVVLDTADGERVIVWHVPPRNGQPVFVYFHGNGGSVRWREERFRDLIDDGSGLVALSYRGYGGSSGRPTEKGLIEDAKAIYAFAVARYAAERLVLWGESLGSALAITLAADNPVGSLVLEAPFTSAVDVGAQHYWFVPVRLLMRDQFRSDLWIGKVRAPVLVVHGENDTVVPISLGERLYGLVRMPKRFVRVARAGHNDLGVHAVAAAKRFIAEQPAL